MQMNNASVSQKNVHAILQHRRLRHVSGICVRNLGPLQEHVGPTALLRLVPSRIVYFKMICMNDVCEAAGESKVIYESDHINLCTNPSWLGFDLPKTKQTAGTWLNLELWVEDSLFDKNLKVLSWNWNLSRLHCIAERLYHGEISFARNALVLQISGSFYSQSEYFSTDTPHGNCPHFKLNEEKASCNVFSLRRMVTSQKSISRSKQRSAEYVSSCENLLQNHEVRSARKNHMEHLRSRIKILKLLLTMETSMLIAEKEDLRDLQSATKDKERNLAESQSAILQKRDHFNEMTDQLVVSRQRINVLSGQLSARRIEVLSELAYIFPILPYTPPSGTKFTTSLKNQKQSPKLSQNFMICGIYLPEAESLNAGDDAKNAVGMGFSSQMLCMISYFLLIPLRYPLMLQGSRSSIIDNVFDKIQEKERIFPLFVKTNKDRFLFEYGVYLLNRNIGQMRFHLGVPTSDLRPTLSNLKTLLEHVISVQQGRKLIVRFPTSFLPNPPVRKLASSPVPARKNSTLPKVVAPEKIHSEVNGVSKAIAGFEEKVQGKSLELHSLRRELFGNRKTSKPIPISSTISHKRNASSSSGASIFSTDSGGVLAKDGIDMSATFLTGLEDLDRGPKSQRESQKPMNIITARNELFKTQSGRSVITKKLTYTTRQSKAGSETTENYLSAKEQHFKIDHFSDPCTSKRTSESSVESQTQNGIAENSTDSSSLNAENDNSVGLALDHATVSEDLDLC